MSVKISYSNKNIGKYTSNTVSFVDEKFNIKNLKKYFSAEEFSYIDDLLKTCDLKKNIFLFELNSKRKYF